MYLSANQYFQIPAGLRQISPQFWMWVCVGVAALVLIVVIGRKLAVANRFAIIGVLLFVGAMVGFNWIYERNEPAWATPAVNWLAGFFPSKGSMRR